MITNCNNLTNNKVVSVSENRIKFTLNNKRLYLINKVVVDNCYIKDGFRCDYLFEIIKQKNVINNVYYLELKGKNILHAVEQLETTLKKCSKEHKNIKKECYIVASRYPKSMTSSQIIKKKFKNKNRVQLFIDTKQKEIILK